ncbi:heme oxygenase-like protein [Basidiobolus meristosporus CBS 931.73]|uniref:Heme oxygenase-like protein n=1 Tax=Basidiobolus meristosporus CBS 931.73 TaxID=1314790 RepID=A0A1Y1Z837_9FUNG|nr:heme oxygenase-like protein [Basidiobolus meristosporus CBS 931.73]|eukprot:ORY06439.1 heme oxygenase-like protein [Basidiobolus meristosporus CBS 931.73]
MAEFSLVDHLLSKYSKQWQAATEHPFLNGVADGTITDRQFNAWLQQDYLYAIDFAKMLGNLLRVAPLGHLDVLFTSCTFMKDELTWFDRKLEERSMKTPSKGWGRKLGSFDKEEVTKQVICAEYGRFMTDRVPTLPYYLQILSIWAIEASYNTAWSKILSRVEPKYQEFPERWGNKDFKKFVTELERTLESEYRVSLSTASGGSESLLQAAEEIFLTIAEFEERFWSMAFADK